MCRRAVYLHPTTANLGFALGRITSYSEPALKITKNNLACYQRANYEIKVLLNLN